MLQNLTSEHLDMVHDWIAEKKGACSQRIETNSVELIADLLKDLSRAISSAEYDPTETQMIETIHQISAVLDRRGVKKAAKKLRLAGNAIPYRD